MIRRSIRILTACLIGLATTHCGGNSSSSDAALFRASGDITSEVEQFRLFLGDPNNGTAPGSAGSGRREINWDGVPAAARNTDTFPGDANLSRGLSISTPGTGLRVADDDFESVNADYAMEFRSFSSPGSFSPVGSNVLELSFTIPGSTVPAAVSAFGAIFVDVDIVGATTIELLGATGSLGSFAAPSRTELEALSFIGVAFPDARITGARITLGNAVLGSADGPGDVVVVDDFVFAEAG